MQQFAEPKKQTMMAAAMLSIVKERREIFGGAVMIQTNQNKEMGKLDQVWVQLSQEDQVGVIHLMAQLVLKLSVAQIESGQKAGCDGQNLG
jgi:hypothetical protein